MRVRASVVSATTRFQTRLLEIIIQQRYCSCSGGVSDTHSHTADACEALYLLLDEQVEVGILPDPWRSGSSPFPPATWPSAKLNH